MNHDRTASFYNHLEFVKHIMASEDYSHLNEAQRQEILQRRIKKFYCTQEVIRVDQEHFKPRIQPIYLEGIGTSNDTIMLFGIDFLKKKELKQMFRQYTTQYYFIDESNCMIYFKSAIEAKMAIKSLVKQDSATKLKIQQDQNIQEGEGLLKETQKAWIELKPYKYTHYINKYTSQDYNRRLHVRYATSQQREFGISKQSFLDYIYKSCQKIWQSGIIKENTKMRVLLQRKMQRIKKVQQHHANNRGKGKFMNQNKVNIFKNNPNQMQEQINIDKEKNIFQCNQKPISSKGNNSIINSKLNQRLNDDIGLQIRSRGDESQYQNMIHQMQELHLIHSNLNESLLLESGSSGLNHHSNHQHNTSFILQHLQDPPNHNSIDISYKVIQPAQIKLNVSPNNSFNYKQYLNTTIEQENKVKKIQYVDLTDI